MPSTEDVIDMIYWQLKFKIPMVWTISASSDVSLAEIYFATTYMLQAEHMNPWALYEYPDDHRVILLMGVAPVWGFGFKLSDDPWSAKDDLNELDDLVTWKI